MSQAVPIKNIGVKLHQDRPVAQVVPGEAFPLGIKALDVEWFERRVINLERIIAANTDEKLRALREEAVQCRELSRLKALAERGE